MRKLKILVSAYACCPSRGSEPGVGWNFVKGLSEYHEVHVIVEKVKWEKPIQSYLRENPNFAQNIKFYFIEKKRNKRLRKIWPPSYYWFYRQWQKKAYRLALVLENREKFDLVHQLTMVGYREPGYLWKLNNPFVWGPIGGLENSPWRFLPSLGFKGLMFYSGRNILNSWQRSFRILPKRAAAHKNSGLIAASPHGAGIIKKLWSREAVIICEVGQEASVTPALKKRFTEVPLKIVWSGVHTPGKNLSLLLKAVSKADYDFELHILGAGEMTNKWKKVAKELDVESQCKWYGWLEYESAMEVFKDGHVFVITSISDLTATVTLEALSYGLPIICLNHLGFAHVVTDECGIKIPVTNPKEAARSISFALKKLYNDETLRQKLSQGAFERVRAFSWDKKIEKLNAIYDGVLNGFDNKVEK